MNVRKIVTSEFKKTLDRQSVTVTTDLLQIAESPFNLKAIQNVVNKDIKKITNDLINVKPRQPHTPHSNARFNPDSNYISRNVRRHGVNSQDINTHNSPNVRIRDVNPQRISKSKSSYNRIHGVHLHTSNARRSDNNIPYGVRTQPIKIRTKQVTSLHFTSEKFITPLQNHEERLKKIAREYAIQIAKVVKKEGTITESDAFKVQQKLKSKYDILICDVYPCEKRLIIGNHGQF